MNTYNKDNVLRDFNTLLDLYLNSSSEEKKINIYSQMLFIYNIESYNEITSSLTEKQKLVLKKLGGK